MPRQAATFNTPLWQAAADITPVSQALDDGEHMDLVVVGAGIMGLSTALHAARRGLSVRVVEALEIGQGASGLNGGQVIPGLKYDPDWLIEHFGEQRGERIIAFASGTADSVFDLIGNERLNVPHARNGWIQAAHTDTALQAAEKRAQQWSARGVNASILGPGEIAAKTGARGYVGGWFDRRAGVIDPLAYTLELARIATEAGARIATNERVTRLTRHAGAWRVGTVSGNSLVAKAVVAATNAYSDGLIPELARTIVPLHSFQIATAPLLPSIASGILPGGQAVSDSRRILIYFRKSPDGRLMLGGRGRMGLPRSAADWAHLERTITRLFPALEGIAVERRWFGRVAMTPDHLPHLHEPEDGLIAAIGCQGRGIGLMTSLGARIADYVATRDPAASPFPVSPIRPIPFHRFRRVGVAAAIAWYRALDALER
ncbi:FAD-dependent oxidoreductase [Mesorhizobium sp. WSM2239]|uniref:FAD-dependent oxidoreductase n=2 Tax=unclassified Mesorhizobium TaxID=325217 RepID=A0AAU8DFT6_9HYPH